MSIVMDMLALNVPLSQWKAFSEQDRGRTCYHGGKNTDKVAQAIFTQLSHEQTVLLIAKEFERFPADLRLQLRTLCNSGNGSGNVRKGVQRLNALMGGNLLREEKHVEHFQVKGRDGWKTKVVNPAVAGATRKYGIVK